MLRLSDKIEKQEKIYPESIHKMPENGTQGESQMTGSGVFILHISVQNPYQYENSGKNVDQVSAGYHIQERGCHIALWTRGVQARFDELSETSKLKVHEAKPEEQSCRKHCGGLSDLVFEQESFGQEKGQAAQQDEYRTDVKGLRQIKGNPVFPATADHIGTGQSGKHHGHAYHRDPKHLLIGPVLCFLFHFHQ